MNNYYSKYAPKIVFAKWMNRFLTPFRAANVQFSVIATANDDPGKATKLLFDTALKSIEAAYDKDLSVVAAREKEGFRYVNVYPGEHYKLLAGLMEVIKPAVVVEIGTYLGQSALTMKPFMPQGSVLHTFDVIPWNQFDSTCLKEEDFKDGTLVQHLDDLTRYDDFIKHKTLMERADFIFVDALKDGKQELLFMENFNRIQLKKDCIIMFDDIKVWNMLKIWRGISRPKLDITSFGHWSGSGLVHWNG